MKNKTCVVVGGAGFIGHHIVNTLIKEGAKVVIVDDLSSGDMRRVPHAVAFYKLDISLQQSVTALHAIFQDVDYVFHLAAKLSVPESIAEPVSYHRTNIDGTQHVLEAARLAKVKKVVLSSSSAVYGDAEKYPSEETDPANPKSPYALHKYYGEQMCQLYSKLYEVPTVCLRYFNVYGIGNRWKGAYAPVIALFVKQFYDGVPLTICGDGKQTRDFIHVSDVVQANLKAALSTTAVSGDVFNIGSGVETSILRLAEMFACEVTHLPPRLEPKFSRADISKASAILNWYPSVSVEDGVGEFLKYPKAIDM